MISHTYLAPVYARVLQFVYMHRQDWSESLHRGPRTWATDTIPRIDLGRHSGKTTAAVAFADQFSDGIVVTRTVDKANNIARNHPSVRVFATEQMDKLAPGHFQSTQPLFIFDDATIKDTLDILVKFKPTRFIHLGCWA